MTIKNGQRILALDASTTAVGWCVAEGSEYIDSGVFVPDGKATWWDRVYEFRCWLDKMLLGDQGIEVVAYERATGNRKNMRTNLKLGAVEYEARRAVSEATNQPRHFEEFTASQVKATGVNKDHLFSARLFKGGALDEKHPGDEADAMGLVFARAKKVGYQPN